MVGLPWASQRRRSKQDTAGRRGTVRPSRFRPRLEVLEGRIAPATRVWDGGGANNLWSTAGNWAGDVAPKSGDDLVFPEGAAQTASVNNFLTGSFARIIVTGTGYSFSGKLAYEMARQLHAAGHRIGAVAIIDTVPEPAPDASWAGLARQAAGFLRNVPRRLLDDLAASTSRDLAARGRVAFVEDQVNDGEDGVEPLGHVGRLGHQIGDTGVTNFALGPHQPLGHRRRGHEKRAGDLVGLQAAEHAEGQAYLGVVGQRGVAAGEDQTQAVVGDLS